MKKWLNHRLTYQRYWQTFSCYHATVTIFNDVIMHSFILLMSLIKSLEETYTNG